LESGGSAVIAFLDVISSLSILGFLGLAVVVPFFAIFSFAVGGGAGAAIPFLNPEILAAAKITFFQASVSAALSLVLGTAVGWLCFNLAGGHRASLRLARTVFSLPFGVPAIVAATAWVLILGKSGFNSGLLYSLNAVILSHVVFNVPWVALWVMNGLEDISQNQREAARTLGANSFQELRHVLLPELAPTLISAFSQVFAVCAMSFALVMILGGGPPVETLETTLYSKIRSGGLDLSGAVACALWQILMTIAPWLALQKFAPRWQARRKSPLSQIPHRSLKRWIAPAIALLFLTPYFVLIRIGSWSQVSALLNDGASCSEIFQGVWTSLKLSFLTAFAAIFVSMAGVWIESRLKEKKMIGFFPFLFILPAGVSTMVTGLGMFIAYQGRGLLDPFSSSLIPVIALQSIFFVALAYRVFRPIAMRFRQSEFEVARTLGASPFQSFVAVEWRRWRGPLLGVFALAFGGAIGEVGAVSLFYNEGRIPLSLLVFRWMAQYRFEDAQAVSLLLLLLALALIMMGSMMGHFEESHE
jgi:thiamine transport system permease protein